MPVAVAVALVVALVVVVAVVLSVVVAVVVALVVATAGPGVVPVLVRMAGTHPYMVSGPPGHVPAPRRLDTYR